MKDRKTDYGTVILHGLFAAGLCVAFVTGLRIATEAPDRQWLNVLDAILPRGASSLRVSGASTALFSGLLRAGFRIDEFPALLCWTRPFADFARYVPNSLALI